MKALYHLPFCAISSLFQKKLVDLHYYFPFPIYAPDCLGITSSALTNRLLTISFSSLLVLVVPMDRYYDSAYASCVLTRAILHALFHRRPQPPKGSRPPADFTTSSPYLMAAAACAPTFSLAPVIGVIALVASGWSFSNSLPLNFCPRPTNVSPTFVTFNKTTVIVLVCTFFESMLRCVAMAQLGRSFTYELAGPAGGFKQDGLYRYMKHPSYIGAFLAHIAFLPFFWRLDGPLGCWMPAWMARSHGLSPRA